MDARAPASDATRVIMLPPKDRVNIGLAVVAGALAVLVLFTAHDRLSAGGASAATPAPSLATSAPTLTPTDAPQAAPRAPKAGDKGKGHD